MDNRDRSKDTAPMSRRAGADEVMPRWRFDIDVDDVTSDDAPKQMLDEVTRGGSVEIPAEHAKAIERAIKAAAMLGKRHPKGAGSFRIEQAASGQIQVQVFHEKLKRATATLVVDEQPNPVPGAPLAPKAAPARTAAAPGGAPQGQGARPQRGSGLVMGKARQPASSLAMAPKGPQAIEPGKGPRGGS